ncbi:HIRAN domain-containing protein [Halopseudomonas xiamenensis]|uniref:HIRAN domain-containing protein n=1 Tax=Halopseudomonas xiamenensis TaxID=157792 RepID=UPI00162774F5|nr:HIRAN domain-containing protein [Halopseudomonas xiamenensis]
MKFRYLKETEDYRLALEEGFIGFPAFTKSSTIFDDALDAFYTRLPPRKRADFGKYLSQYGLPENFNGSHMALLGYTGARLASDSFELCPDYSDVTAPADILMEVTGAHYHVELARLPPPGEQVEFLPEPDNPHDKNAIAVIYRGAKIGYINKTTAIGFNKMLTTMDVSGCILNL